MQHFICKFTNLLKTIPLKELEIGNWSRISVGTSEHYQEDLSSHYHAHLNFIYFFNGIWMILWAVDLIILAIHRITSQFRWVELASFVSYLMECIWEERYINMNVFETWYYAHYLQY